MGFIREIVVVREVVQGVMSPLPVTIPDNVAKLVMSAQYQTNDGLEAVTAGTLSATAKSKKGFKTYTLNVKNGNHGGENGGGAAAALSYPVNTQLPQLIDVETIGIITLSAAGLALEDGQIEFRFELYN